MNALQTSLDTIVRNIWVIPNNNKVIFPANQSYQPKNLALPFAIVNTSLRSTENSLVFGDNYSEYNLTLWLAIATNNNVNALDILKQKLLDMVKELFYNSSLNNIISFTDIIEVNWVGTEDNLNFTTLPSIGLRYGYVAFRAITSGGF